MVKTENDELKKLTFQLDAVEHMIEDGSLRLAHSLLDQVEMDDFHPLAPWYFCLHGHILEKNKDYKSAEKKHLEAIQVYSKYNLNPTDNIIARCYNGLGICRYFQNDYDHAIDYINQGLEAYDDTKEMKQIKYKLYINKVLYLMNASRNDEALLILNEVWPLRSEIDINNGALLDFYSFRAIFLRNRGLFQEAINVCEEGFKILKGINSRNRYLDLLNILGSIHLYLKELDTAYDRFTLALASDQDAKYPRRQVESHTWLGILYNCKKEWSKAKKHLEISIDLSKKIPNTSGLAKALIVMGNTHYFQNSYLEAISYYEQAITICEEHGHRHRQYSALLKKADCFVKMGKIEDPDFIDCLKKKFLLGIDINLKSEEDAYEIV
ncbi:tetratricopeptide (TPR) repeat protein [Croceifilum oryzae]|uniref:Tetratricopeptide (TPR) repeat protein n=1 Tax=Croceifilum oryzae TaxID=1553429 RepID=A0AAJ1TH67_9BACL|nr:tetratricopeptide repeat protein [Croceifilum oryzae]MDQ0416477.1 tetratricopeptide (TPR) repeat protein [Croceifilum oryzae]